jgi:signal transduction histidine kinase
MVYLLETPSGTLVAGSLAPIPPVAGTFDLKEPMKSPAANELLHAVHARGVILPDGNFLVVGADSFPLHAMRALILKAFGWSFGITLVLALGLGILLSRSLLRRVEAVTRTSRAIIDGNLSQRIPTRGTEDEFDRLAAGLNLMLERTEGAMEAMRQVTNDIAHDLRTPLSRLRQRLELAQRKAISAAELHATIEHAVADTDAILETFGALLRIAQIESGSRKQQFTTVDLTDLVQVIGDVYQSAAEEKYQSLTVTAAPGLAIRGDRELLAQMVANLVENAVRHSPDGTTIAVRAARVPGGVEVTVSDHGPGIPATEHGKVFRRFYRLETSRSTPGNGLGLSLVAAVAALHEVTVVLSDNQPGLRVSLRFPALSDAVAAAVESPPMAG